MGLKFVGHLAMSDPLFHYLRHDILLALGIVTEHARFRVFKLRGTNDVYLYEEKYSAARLVGKFFMGEHCPDKSAALHKAQREFISLKTLRGDYGLKTSPHYVVRPLGINQDINSVLMLEYCYGESLSEIIQDAIFHNRRERLFRKLTALAYYLATQHNRTADDTHVNFNVTCAYMDKLVHQLYTHAAISDDEQKELWWWRDRWREQPCMWADRQVLVHGDATPSNLLFGAGLNVIALDLERMQRTDRIFDVGRIAGELKHFFLRATGDKYAAEPFIGHFLWEYACHFPDREHAFRAITARTPLHMALTLLRIARNDWIDHSYRRRLIDEAKLTLRSY